MLLRIGESTVKVEPENFQYEVSKHTGEKLEKFSFELNIDGYLSELLDSLKNEVYQINGDNNKILKKYKVTNKSYSYTGNNQSNNTIYNFDIELTEVEDLNIESLIIAGVETYPYVYSEKYDGDSLIINAKIKTPYEQLKKIKEKTDGKDYFEVIRKGINEETKMMRFGKVIWSKHENFAKQDLVLVEKNYDDNNRKEGFNYPEIGNMMETLAYTNIFIKEISNLLVSKGVLSNEEIKELESKINDRASEKIGEFYLVKDIDLS